MKRADRGPCDPYIRPARTPGFITIGLIARDTPNPSTLLNGRANVVETGANRLCGLRLLDRLRRRPDDAEPTAKQTCEFGGGGNPRSDKQAGTFAEEN